MVRQQFKLSCHTVRRCAYLDSRGQKSQRGRQRVLRRGEWNIVGSRGRLRFQKGVLNRQPGRRGERRGVRVIKMPRQNAALERRIALKRRVRREMCRTEQRRGCSRLAPENAVRCGTRCSRGHGRAPNPPGTCRYPPEAPEPPCRSILVKCLPL